MPVTAQVTAVFDVPVTVAVNCCWPFTARVTEEGETETLTVVELPIVTVAMPTCVASNIDAAVTMTVAGDGAVAGAV